MLELYKVTLIISSVHIDTNSVFLVDRTNGRAIGRVFRLSVCLWRYVLWLNGAS